MFKQDLIIFQKKVKKLFSRNKTVVRECSNKNHVQIKVSKVLKIYQNKGKN